MKINPAIWFRVRFRTRIVGPVLALAALPLGLAAGAIWSTHIGLLVGGGLVVLALLSMVAAGAVEELWADSLRRRLRQTGFRLCPYCTYDLTHLSQSGTLVACPECGNRLELGVVEDAWRQSWIFQPPRPPTPPHPPARR